LANSFLFFLSASGFFVSKDSRLKKNAQNILIKNQIIYFKKFYLPPLAPPFEILGLAKFPSLGGKFFLSLRALAQNIFSTPKRGRALKRARRLTFFYPFGAEDQRTQKRKTALAEDFPFKKIKF
jgi:hypothetical protein